MSQQLLLEREEEIERIKTALEQLSGGVGSLLIIEGPAGILVDVGHVPS